MKAGDLYVQFLARITGAPPAHVFELAVELAHKNALPSPDAEVTAEERGELLDLLRNKRHHLIRSLFIDGLVHCGWPLFNCACASGLPGEGSASASGEELHAEAMEECCPCCCERAYDPEGPKCRGCIFADRCC